MAQSLTLVRRGTPLGINGASDVSGKVRPTAPAGRDVRVFFDCRIIEDCQTSPRSGGSSAACSDPKCELAAESSAACANLEARAGHKSATLSQTLVKSGTLVYRFTSYSDRDFNSHGHSVKLVTIVYGKDRLDEWFVPVNFISPGR